MGRRKAGPVQEEWAGAWEIKSSEMWRATSIKFLFESFCRCTHLVFAALWLNSSHSFWNVFSMGNVATKPRLFFDHLPPDLIERIVLLSLSKRPNFAHLLLYLLPLDVLNLFLIAPEPLRTVEQKNVTPSQMLQEFWDIRPFLIFVLIYQLPRGGTNHDPRNFTCDYNSKQTLPSKPSYNASCSGSVPAEEGNGKRCKQKLLAAVRVDWMKGDLLPAWTLIEASTLVDFKAWDGNKRWRKWYPVSVGVEAGCRGLKAQSSPPSWCSRRGECTNADSPVHWWRWVYVVDAQVTTEDFIWRGFSICTSLCRVPSGVDHLEQYVAKIAVRRWDGRRMTMWVMEGQKKRPSWWLNRTVSTRSIRVVGTT